MTLTSGQKLMLALVQVAVIVLGFYLLDWQRKGASLTEARRNLQQHQADVEAQPTKEKRYRQDRARAITLEKTLRQYAVYRMPRETHTAAIYAPFAKELEQAEVLGVTLRDVVAGPLLDTLGPLGGQHFTVHMVGPAAGCLAFVRGLDPHRFPRLVNVVSLATTADAVGTWAMTLELDAYRRF